MRIMLALLLAVLSPAPAGAQTETAARPRPLAFTHVTVIDTLHRSFASGADPAFRDDPRLKYMPPNIRRLFDWELGFFNSYRPVYERQLLMAGAMRRAGVKFLAGTDTFNAYCFPGFSVHDELELFVRAGFTPLEALQTATLNPARYLGLSGSLGTIEKGKLADLVLLDANPLENIGNTRRIAAVVAAGRYLPKESLQRMLAEVEAAASKITSSSAPSAMSAKSSSALLTRRSSRTRPSRR